MASTEAVANSVVGSTKTPTVVKEEGKQDLVYVTIPEKTVLGWEHPGIGINLQHYAPGTHAVPQLIADEINERLRVHHQGQLELLQPQISRLVGRKLSSPIG